MSDATQSISSGGNVPSPGAAPATPAGGGAAPLPGPASAAPPPIVMPPQGLSWAQAFNLAALALLLWFAIGAACQILTRNEDHARITGYQNWLLSCKTNPGADKTCPGVNDLDGQIAVTSHQVRRYNSLNSIGAGDRCSIAVIFASPIGHFYEDCIVLTSKGDKFHAPANQIHLQPIVYPPLLSYTGYPLQLDQAAKEHLYFFLVLASAAIGSLIAGLRTAGITTLRDLALGLGAGFAVYLLLRGGNVVFFAPGAGQIDILNPFTAAAAGFLVGLFSDKAFRMLDGVVATGQTGAVQAAATAQAGATAAAQAAQKKATAVAEAAKAVAEAAEAADNAGKALAKAAELAGKGDPGAAAAQAAAVEAATKAKQAGETAAKTQAIAAAL